MNFFKIEIMKFDYDEIYFYYWYVFLDKNESFINFNSLKKRKILKVKYNRCV